jgi:hypothetical protein
LQLPQRFNFSCLVHLDQSFIPKQLFWLRSTIHVK